MLIQNIYYLCSQKVEEEIGSAGEQPISNKLSALYSKSKGDGICCPFFTFTGIALWSKKTQYYRFANFTLKVNSIINPTKTTFYQWTKPQIHFFVK